jgi:hypothetical protein
VGSLAAASTPSRRRGIADAIDATVFSLCHAAT